MAELTPDLEKVLKDAGMDGSACWKHKQSGKWIVYHWACERLAAHYRVQFETPQVLENDAGASVALLVEGKRHLVSDDKDHEMFISDWSIGEASPQNNKNPYPYAMAEKRAKDRVILKLVGLHGLAYSEEEADDFKARNPDTMEQNRQKSDDLAAKHVGNYLDKRAKDTLSDLPKNEQEWKEWAANAFMPAVEGCKTAPALDKVMERFDERLKALKHASENYHKHLVSIADSRRADLLTPMDAG